MAPPDTQISREGLLAALLMLSGAAEPRVAALLAAHPLEVLARFDADALRVAGGLSAKQAARLAAAFALGREVERASRPRRARLDRPAAVARLLAPEVRGLEVETFHTLVLDARQELVAHERVAMGTLMTAPVHPREVFRPALRRTCAAIIVAHNHPSGDPEPSAEDLAVTRRLAEAGRILGVPLLDHVVLGDGRWVSLRERGALESPAHAATG